MDFVRSADDIDQPIGERARLVRALQRKLHHGKFVAAEPRDHVGIAQALPEPLRYGPEKLIADRMAECIVDAFEMIEIEAVNGEAFTVPVHSRQQFLEPLMEQHAVRQIGQRIVMRHIGDTGFRGFALRTACFLPNGTRRP
jgi:hypothetical protein